MRYFQLCPHCGRAAWEYKKKPQKGDMLTVGSILHAANPKEGEKIKCQLCAKAIPPWALKSENVIEVSGLEEVKEVKRWQGGKEAGWYFIHMGEQATRVMFFCPFCLEGRDLKNHEIAEDGTVTPEVMCPCGKYHEEVKLTDWPQYSKERGDRFAKT